MKSRSMEALLAAALVCAAGEASAQDRAAFGAAMDAFARRAMQRVEAAPGLAVAVVDRDGLVHAAGFGVADVATGAAVTTETRFYIASATKSFTALSLAAMARRGEVDLDAPLADWAPPSGVPADIAARITLTDLLSHRSGVDNDPIAFRVAYSGDWSPEVLWGLTAETRPRATPYGQFVYANAGYNLATVLSERRWGRDWHERVEDEVLTPLGMTATTARIDAARAAGAVVAAGHFGRVPGQPERSPLQKTDATMQSAGGLISTASDMALWLEAQINDGRVGGRQVFPAGLVASTHVSQVTQAATFGPYVRTGYGLGWQVGRYGEDVLIHHFGNFSGSRAHVSFMPERRLGVAVMVNEDAFAGDLADVVANYAYDWFAGLPDIEAVYDARLDALIAERDRRRAGVAATVEGRAKRPRTLSLPNAAYVGDYVNPAYGSLAIREAGERLSVAIGVQQALADYLTEPEGLRVELTPFRGEGVVFKLDAEGRPTTLVYQDAVFVRD
ncbi:CubicO group peptidase (beta-lactamase class C family) [Brevundimonas bullata]|uniref:CubicO group peptidase (Beta-lactamase class C family) n=1 Tax=Brevundimonas bullata TaxID=13160 RepID=A0A7W7IMZ1_9CAUL|nr:serine hydrolase [Brevundimonas bullata]MBB4797242.1 CubicO group peptidase (beta-lactamase class C family) [Brevundimonas bullata]MBB6382201.1 CubicO group peptidase (beta-lactamase class C family) [Brevundimonas bullata]